MDDFGIWNILEILLIGFMISMWIDYWKPLFALGLLALGFYAIEELK